MGKIHNYYLLPLQTSFKYREVINTLEEQLRQLSKFQGVEFDVHLRDNYVWHEPIPIDPNAHFAWRSPEMESLVILFKQGKSPNQFLEVDCDFLQHNFEIEEIAEESGILNEDQLAIVKHEDYWYWSFSIIENEIEPVYVDAFVKSMLQLSKGIVFCCIDNWELLIHPNFAWFPTANST